jgi:Tfp pilus assembly protein PilO
MLEKLMKYLPIIIILYSGYDLYTLHLEHEELLDSKQQTVPAIENRIRRLKKERKEVDSYMADIESAKKRIELVAQEVESLQRKLPSNISDPENLAMFQGFTDNLNIRDVSVVPGPEENLGFYFKKRYDLKGQGTFLQFLILMEKISENERLLNIRSVKMYKDNDTKVRGRFQLIKGEMTIEAYRYNPDHKENRAIQKAPEVAPGEKA